MVGQDTAEINLHVQEYLTRFGDEQKEFGPEIAEHRKIREALRFLDGFSVQAEGTSEMEEPETAKTAGRMGTEAGKGETSEGAEFELWLRGLIPQPSKLLGVRFQDLAAGLFVWAQHRATFYEKLEASKNNSNAEREEKRGTSGERRTSIEGEWTPKNPLAARFGVVDLYWLARILRAEVSADGVVTYDRRSWLYYLPGMSPEAYPMKKIVWIEEVLRSIFDFACELIQNAVEIEERLELDKIDPPPARKWTKDWREVYDKEIEQVASQRRERVFKDESSANRIYGTVGGGRDGYWSRRICSGEHEENLVGLALSGGGIRSATFALGVLQALKEFDFLRQVDYLSTVSGGGYAGAWLLGNVRRTNYWLSRMTNWEESIAHLRRYSKYLAPQSGILSADTWVIWGTWIRNALLIQLSTISWLASLFVFAIGLKLVFENISMGVGQVALLAVMLGLVVILLLNLWIPVVKQQTQHRTAVVLAWVGSFLTAALLWQGAETAQNYSAILANAGGQWPWYLSAVLVGCLFVLAVFSVLRQRKPEDPGEAVAKIAGSLGIAVLTAGVAYLCLCGVVYLFDIWASMGKPHFSWYAYILGPTLVLLSITLAVIVFVGLVGRTSADWRREWWTRYGSWLAIFGAAFLAIGLAAVFGPFWVVRLARRHWAIPWSAAAGWAGSVIAGLFAGNSGKTKGNESPGALEWVAKIGGLIFIIGALLGVSTLVQVLIVEVWDVNQSGWWNKLNHFVYYCGEHSRQLGQLGPVTITFLVLLLCGLLFSWRVNINIFGLNQFYRNRLARCYLGATRWQPGLRKPEVFTGFDDDDDLELTDLQFDSGGVSHKPFRGPFPIVNCSLNLGGSADLSVHTRQSASFTLTPIYAGADRRLVGYAPVQNKDESFSDRVTLGQAISVSGAAASPNMGYNTSPW